MTQPAMDFPDFPDLVPGYWLRRSIMLAVLGSKSPIAALLRENAAIQGSVFCIYPLRMIASLHIGGRLAHQEFE